MLSARVVAEGVRAVFPACLNGVYLAEEVADFDTKPASPKAAVASIVDAPMPVLETETASIRVELVQEGQTTSEPIKAKVDAPVEIANWWNAEVEKQIIQAGEDVVNDYLASKGKIEPSDTWKDIKDETYRSNLVAKTSKFIEAVLKAQQ